MSIESISLSGRKKQVSNKEMTFWERMYLVAIVKGLIITIQHLFTRKVTIQYPEQVREMSPVYRGQHMLKRDELVVKTVPLVVCVPCLAQPKLLL
jgi:NADH-quinone oxidoreductase subunit I